MPEFVRTIHQAEQPLYEQVVAEMQAATAGSPKMEIVQAEPGASTGVVRLHLRYAHEIDILVLGLKLGRAQMGGGPGNG